MFVFASQELRSIDNEKHLPNVPTKTKKTIGITKKIPKNNITAFSISLHI